MTSLYRIYFIFIECCYKLWSYSLFSLTLFSYLILIRTHNSHFANKWKNCLETMFSRTYFLMTEVRYKIWKRICAKEARERCNRYILVITFKMTFFPPLMKVNIKSFYIDKCLTRKIKNSRRMENSIYSTWKTIQTTNKATRTTTAMASMQANSEKRRRKKPKKTNQPTIANM